MKLSDLESLPLTYAEAGATAGPLPAGYHHVKKSAIIGKGQLLRRPASVGAWCASRRQVEATLRRGRR